MDRFSTRWIVSGAQKYSIGLSLFKRRWIVQGAQRIFIWGSFFYTMNFSWNPGVHHIFSLENRFSRMKCFRRTTYFHFRNVFLHDELFQARKNFPFQDRFSKMNCFRHATYSAWESRFYSVTRWIVAGTRPPRISTSGSFSKMKCSRGTPHKNKPISTL